MTTSGERRLNRLYMDFTNMIANTNIAKYYNIDDSRFSIKRINTHTFQFDSVYKKSIKMILKLKLPDDIIYYIKTFIIKKKESQFEMCYPIDYQFKGPIWKLLNTSENEVEYKKMVQILNYSYEMEWSPAIIFEKDILYMIQQLVKIIN